MNRHYFLKNDDRGKKLYNKIVENNYIDKDYFYKKDENFIELEKLFKTNSYYFSSSSEKVKIKLLYRLKDYGLKIYDYFNLIELFFNKYYYNLILEKDDEEKIKKYFTF